MNDGIVVHENQGRRQMANGTHHPPKHRRFSGRSDVRMFDLSTQGEDALQAGSIEHREGRGMTERFAYVCPNCLEVEWVDRVGLVLNAVRGSRRFKVCEKCSELTE